MDKNVVIAMFIIQVVKTQQSSNHKTNKNCNYDSSHTCNHDRITVNMIVRTKVVGPLKDRPGGKVWRSVENTLKI